jgi:beta-aspartyl-peptidase (threonine type)
MMNRVLLLVLVGLGGCAGAAAARERQEIQVVLQRQAAAWNRGDLEAFLAGYWRSERTVFAGGDQVHRGFDAMARRYREAYPAPEKMGLLTFSDLTFEQLEPDRAVVTGSWELKIAGSDKRPGGVFTLLWRRFEDGWKIVHDHTSSRP